MKFYIHNERTGQGLPGAATSGKPRFIRLSLITNCIWFVCEYSGNKVMPYSQCA